MDRGPRPPGWNEEYEKEWAQYSALVNEIFKKEFGVGYPDIRGVLQVPGVEEYIKKAFGLAFGSPPPKPPPREEWSKTIDTIRFLVENEAERLRNEGYILPNPEIEVVALRDFNVSDEDLRSLFQAVQNLGQNKIFSPDGTRTMLFFAHTDGLTLGIESNWASLEELSELLASMGIAVRPDRLESIVPRNYDKRPGTWNRLAFPMPGSVYDLQQYMAMTEQDFKRTDTHMWAHFVENARELATEL